jgi:hypothetical protein
MTDKKHQRSCTTCIWSKQKAIATKDHPELSLINLDNWHHACTNPDGKIYKISPGRYDAANYKKGQVCHTKLGETSLASNDYVEYQKGAIKLRLSNNKMTLTLSAQNVPFNSAEKRKIEKDLADVFEVVTLASEKIPVVENTKTIGAVEL